MTVQHPWLFTFWLVIVCDCIVRVARVIAVGVERRSGSK